MSKPFFTYILYCADKSYYTGSTDNLEQRITEHQHGEGSKWTQTRLPVKLIWSQEFTTRDEARETEQQIKRWSRAKKEALILGKFDLISDLASRSKLSLALRDG